MAGSFPAEDAAPEIAVAEVVQVERPQREPAVAVLASAVGAAVHAVA